MRRSISRRSYPPTPVMGRRHSSMRRVNRGVPMLPVEAMYAFDQSTPSEFWATNHLCPAVVAREAHELAAPLVGLDPEATVLQAPLDALVAAHLPLVERQPRATALLHLGHPVLSPAIYAPHSAGQVPVRRRQVEQDPVVLPAEALRCPLPVAAPDPPLALGTLPREGEAVVERADDLDVFACGACFDKRLRLLRAHVSGDGARLSDVHGVLSQVSRRLRRDGWICRRANGWRAPDGDPERGPEFLQQLLDADLRLDPDLRLGLLLPRRGGPPSPGH